MAQFSKGRFQARLYGFCWTILETRQPDFNAEKVKKQSPMLTVVQALNFASESEKQIINQLTDIIKLKPESSDQGESLLGAIEGKKVVYQKLDPHLLLKDQDLTDVGGKNNTKQNSSTFKSCLIPIAILFLVIIGFRIHNSDFCRERRAYRAIVKAETTVEEDQAILDYIADFPNGKHSEDVYYRSAKLNANDDFYITRYLDKYPHGKHYAEVELLYDNCLYNYIADKQYHMTDVMTYLSVFPRGIHALRVNQMCDSIWESEAAKYHAQLKTKKATKAVKYIDAMLEYMRNQRVNVLVITTESTLKLKDYTEYSQSVRDNIEANDYYEYLPIHGNVVSLKNNFSQGSQEALNQILSRGLQASFDSIFTPGFIQVTDDIRNAKKSCPSAVFHYEIKSQEYNQWGTTYPHLWIYSVNNIPMKYLIGIAISCRVKFTIPNSDITYELSGKGAPEKDISGIKNLSDGYKQMTMISFARFSNDLYSKFGLKKIY